jgi:hypothetical protein
MVGHGGSWVDHVCLRGVGCHKAPRDVAALGRRQGDDAVVGHDQHADGDPQRRSVHRPARRCKPAGRAWRRYLLANDARPMPKSSWLRPRPAGAPEAAFSARSCLRLPQLRSALSQPWPLSRLGQHWPAMLALFRHGARLEFVRPDVLQPAEVAVEIPGTIVGAAIRRDEAAAGASGTPGEARLRRSLRRHRCLRREHPAAFRAAGAVALAWKGHAAEA